MPEVRAAGFVQLRSREVELDVAIVSFVELQVRRHDLEKPRPGRLHTLIAMASPTPSTRAIAKVFATFAMLSLLTYVLYLVRSVLMLVLISVFLAVALGPAVDLFHRRLPRALSIVLVYVSIVLVIFGVGLLVVPPIVSQVNGLSKDIPGYLHKLNRNRQFRKYDSKYGITKKLNQQARKLPSRLGQAAGALQDVTVGVFAALIQLVTVLTLTFFMLLDGRRAVDFLFRLLGPARESRYREVAEDIYRATAGYVAGNLIISTIAGTVTYVALTLLGVPFAVPLAVLMGARADRLPAAREQPGGLDVLDDPRVRAVVMPAAQVVDHALECPACGSHPLDGRDLRLDREDRLDLQRRPQPCARGADTPASP